MNPLHGAVCTLCAIAEEGLRAEMVLPRFRFSRFIVLLLGACGRSAPPRK